MGVMNKDGIKVGRENEKREGKEDPGKAKQ
jgi:hypothetical protein